MKKSKIFHVIKCEAQEKKKGKLVFWQWGKELITYF